MGRKSTFFSYTVKKTKELGGPNTSQKQALTGTEHLSSK